MKILSVLSVCFATDSWSTAFLSTTKKCAACERTSYPPGSSCGKDSNCINGSNFSSGSSPSLLPSPQLLPPLHPAIASAVDCPTTQTCCRTKWGAWNVDLGPHIGLCCEVDNGGPRILTLSLVVSSTRPKRPLELKNSGDSGKRLYHVIPQGGRRGQVHRSLCPQHS